MDPLHLYDYVPHGMENQTLEVTLRPGQTIHAENGAMSFMENGIAMSTGAGRSRGPLALFKRRIAGETILINVFTNGADAPPAPGPQPPGTGPHNPPWSWTPAGRTSYAGRAGSSQGTRT